MVGTKGDRPAHADGQRRVSEPLLACCRDHLRRLSRRPDQEAAAWVRNISMVDVVRLLPAS